MPYITRKQASEITNKDISTIKRFTVKNLKSSNGKIKIENGIYLIDEEYLLKNYPANSPKALKQVKPQENPLAETTLKILYDQLRIKDTQIAQLLESNKKYQLQLSPPAPAPTAKKRRWFFWF
jgi:hypothetical protein